MLPFLVDLFSVICIYSPLGLDLVDYSVWIAASHGIELGIWAVWTLFYCSPGILRDFLICLDLDLFGARHYYFCFSGLNLGLVCSIGIQYLLMKINQASVEDGIDTKSDTPVKMANIGT